MKSRVAALVSSQWLKSQLGVKTKTKVLDASWNLNHTGPEQYFSKHIPGALFFDQNRCAKPRPTCARPFPESECFQEYLRSLGISMDNHLVVYDQGGLVPAARAWWTLRAMGHPAVSVLNGGLQQWVKDGEPTEMGEHKYDGPAGDFELERQDGIIRVFKEMETIAESGSSQVLDARKKEDFLGHGDDLPRASVAALESYSQPVPERMNKGHIRGAVHFPLGPLKETETGLIKSKEDLFKVFESAGVKFDRPVTTLCYNGNNASFVALCAAAAGKEDAAVYYSIDQLDQLCSKRSLVVLASDVPASGGLKELTSKEATEKRREETFANYHACVGPTVMFDTPLEAHERGLSADKKIE